MSGYGDAEFQARAAANRAGSPRTWVCQCGHSYAAHTLARDPTPSAPSIYHYFACRKCPCSRFMSEYDATQEAASR